MSTEPTNPEGEPGGVKEKEDTTAAEPVATDLTIPSEDEERDADVFSRLFLESPQQDQEKNVQTKKSTKQRRTKEMPDPDTITTLDKWHDFSANMHRYEEDTDEIHDVTRDVAKRLLRTDTDRELYEMLRPNPNKLQELVTLLFQEEINAKNPIPSIKIPTLPARPPGKNKQQLHKWLKEVLNIRHDVAEKYDDWNQDAGRYAEPGEELDLDKGIYPRRAPILDRAPAQANPNDYPDFKLNDPLPDHSDLLHDYRCYLEAADAWVKWAHKLPQPDRVTWLANAGNLSYTPKTATFANSKYSKRNYCWANLTLAKIIYGKDEVIKANKILEYQQAYPKADLTKWEPNDDGPAPQHAEKLKKTPDKGKGRATPTKRKVIDLDDLDIDTPSKTTRRRNTSATKRSRVNIEPETQGGPSVQRLDSMEHATATNRLDDDTRRFYTDVLAKIEALTASNLSIARSHERMAQSQAQLAQATKDLQQTMLANHTNSNITQLAMMQNLQTAPMNHQNMRTNGVVNQNVGMHAIPNDPYATHTQRHDYHTTAFTNPTSTPSQSQNQGSGFTPINQTAEGSGNAHNADLDFMGMHFNNGSVDERGTQ